MYKEDIIPRMGPSQLYHVGCIPPPVQSTLPYPRQTHVKPKQVTCRFQRTPPKMSRIWNLRRQQSNVPYGPS